MAELLLCHIYSLPMWLASQTFQQGLVMAMHKAHTCVRAFGGWLVGWATRLGGSANWPVSWGGLLLHSCKCACTHVHEQLLLVLHMESHLLA
jgi:hypothetical protein